MRTRSTTIGPAARWLTAAWLALALGGASHGIEFRRSIPIRTPETLEVAYLEQVRRLCEPDPCTDLHPRDPPVQVRRPAVRVAFRALEESWNAGRLGPLVAETFFDKNRLLDTLAEVVPRDARLKLLAIQNVEVLAQFVRPAAGGQPAQRLSVVSTRASTQIQFTDPREGFVRSRRSTQEYVLVIAEED